MQNSVIIYSPETKTFTSQKKERYMRETRNQLSVFEVVPDTEKVCDNTVQ